MKISKTTKSAKTEKSSKFPALNKDGVKHIMPNGCMVTISEWKGKLTFNLFDKDAADKYKKYDEEPRFGGASMQLRKVKLILDNIEALKKFVADNSSSK